MSTDEGGVAGRAEPPGLSPCGSTARRPLLTQLRTSRRRRVGTVGRANKEPLCSLVRSAGWRRPPWPVPRRLPRAWQERMSTGAEVARARGLVEHGHEGVLGRGRMRSCSSRGKATTATRSHGLALVAEPRHERWGLTSTSAWNGCEGFASPRRERPGAHGWPTHPVPDLPVGARPLSSWARETLAPLLFPGRRTSRSAPGAHGAAQRQARPRPTWSPSSPCRATSTTASGRDPTPSLRPCSTSPRARATSAPVLIRSCHALGADGLIVTGHGTDVYNPQTVRASIPGLLVFAPTHRADSPCVARCGAG